MLHKILWTLAILVGLAVILGLIEHFFGIKDKTPLGK